MAARAARADPRGRRALQPQVVEGAVQLRADLVEHLLAGDQLVCGHAALYCPAGTSHDRAISTHTRLPSKLILFHQL